MKRKPVMCPRCRSREIDVYNGIIECFDCRARSSVKELRQRLHELCTTKKKKGRKKKKGVRSPQQRPSTFKTRKQALNFYESAEWRKLRYEIMKRDGARCVLCNADRINGVKLHVDHIRPLRKYWNLRLNPANLQVLCEVCNHSKGNSDETDWR